MFAFALDVVFGLLIGSRKWGPANTVLASLAGGLITVVVFRTLRTLLGYEANAGAEAALISSIVNGVIVYVCALLWRRRNRRGWGA